MIIKILIKALLSSLLACSLLACASTSNTQANAQSHAIDEQLKEITVSRGVLDLLANETDETKLREELVCGHERLPGSLKKVKVCRTQTEIDKAQAIAKEDLELIQRRSLTNPID